jgi:hypothetical protein
MFVTSADVVNRFTYVDSVDYAFSALEFLIKQSSIVWSYHFGKIGADHLISGEPAFQAGHGTLCD